MTSTASAARPVRGLAGDAAEPAPVLPTDGCRPASHRQGLRSRLAHLPNGPALVVMVVLAVAVVPWLAIFHGNPTGFVRFGHLFAGATHPPAGAVVDSRTGYDGQYFWAMANDPLLLRDGTGADFAGAGFRLQRIAYPALAFVLAAGQPDAVPWTLLAINIIAVLGITIAFARWATHRRISPWWALAVGLLPGFVVATIGDMSDVLATGAMLGGLMMWQGRRRWPAAVLLALAALARDPMILAVAAVAVEAGVCAWRHRAQPGGAMTIIRAAWPVVALPSIVFLAWQSYLHLRFNGPITPPGTAYQPPFAAIVAGVRGALNGSHVFGDGWDLAYLALMLAGIGLSFALLRRRLTASALAAALFGLSLLLLTFGSDWSYTRLSAPMFAALLLAALERGARPALVLCAAVAAMGAVSPLALG